MTTRPKRKTPPLSAKLAACERRLCELLGTDQIQYDHRPALWEREVNAAGTDYIPPQNDPGYIEALSREEHRLRTSGNGATSYGSDSHNRAKEDRITGKTGNGPVKKIPARANPWPPKGSRKLASRPFQRKEARR